MVDWKKLIADTKAKIFKYEEMKAATTSDVIAGHWEVELIGLRLNLKYFERDAAREAEVCEAIGARILGVVHGG